MVGIFIVQGIVIQLISHSTQHQKRFFIELYNIKIKDLFSITQSNSPIPSFPRIKKKKKAQRDEGIQQRTHSSLWPCRADNNSLQIFKKRRIDLSCATPKDKISGKTREDQIKKKCLTNLCSTVEIGYLGLPLSPLFIY